ncbi:uncharacterized protein LOC126777103 isoform X2 [Nymphalis io]|uniref:uncharacterized protein LOC126777103 isoform X2 n=1 Tax=Inachis io TaxID=171585 RepID=UPI00216752E5|nr:uncharacterized protein LOC126777103 isoform X2 [Nymphalis io]
MTSPKMDIMDNIPKSKKIMTKDEVALLIDLIQSNPILTSKETNATTNKTKEDTWTTLTSTFNAKNCYIPRSKVQLKLKWDNLKKAARKRSQQIRMNNLKTDGEPDAIPPDDILEKVSSLLGSASTSIVIPFGNDGNGCGNTEVDGDNKSDTVDGTHVYEDVFVADDERHILPDDVEVLIETPSKDIQTRKRKIVANQEENTTEPESPKLYFGMPLSDQLKLKKIDKKKTDHDGRLARNLAIARYFDKKTEKLDLEIKLLRLEFENKQNRNNNVNSVV